MDSKPLEQVLFVQTDERSVHYDIVTEAGGTGLSLYSLQYM